MRYLSALALLALLAVVGSACGDRNLIVVDGDSNVDGDESIVDGDQPEDGDVDADGDSDVIDGDSDGDHDEDGDAPIDGDLEIAEWPDEAANRVVYELVGPTSRNRPTPYNRLPFPYDHFTVADSTALTGLRVNLLETAGIDIKITNTNLIDTGIHLLKSERYLDGVNTMDGFSTYGYMFAEIFPDVDAEQLPETPEESVEDDSLVWLLNISPDSDKFGERVPVWVARRDAIEFSTEIAYDPENPDSYEHQFYYIAIRPLRPLDEQTHYALVIRKGLKTPDGDLLEASRHFMAVAGLLPIPAELPNAELLQAEKTRLAPMFDQLGDEAIGLSADDVLLAFDFTTQTVSHTIMTIQQWIDDDELVAPQPNFDNNGDNEPDIYTSREQYPTGNGGFPSFSIDMTYIGGWVHGTFKSTDFRLPYQVEENPNRRRAIEYDENGDPIPQETIDVPFVLFFPKDPAAQPCPVVIAQHGISNRKEGVIRYAPEMARRGWATIVMDFPYHGEREVGFAPLEFIDIAYPLKARSSFLQSSVDQLQMIRMINEWDLDIYPAGGDGKVDLDGTRVGYMGTSLGGIVGGLTGSVSHTLRGTVINVGGGGLIDFVEDFLDDYGLIALYPDYYFKQFSTIAQTILDGGDCVNYARFALNPPEGFVAKSILLQESIDDETVPNTVSENFALAALLPHIQPVVRDVYGLDPIAAPQSQFGFVQFDPATHNSLFSNPETNDAAYRMSEQIMYFMETLFDTGTAEIDLFERPTE